MQGQTVPVGSLSEPCGGEKVKIEAPIVSGVDRIESRIHLLQDRLMALEQRLSPLLKPIPMPECPPQPANPKPRPCLSVLTIKLEDLGDHLNAMVHETEDLLNRIEL